MAPNRLQSPNGPACVICSSLSVTPDLLTSSSSFASQYTKFIYWYFCFTGFSVFFIMAGILSLQLLQASGIAMVTSVVVTVVRAHPAACSTSYHADLHREDSDFTTAGRRVIHVPTSKFCGTDSIFAFVCFLWMLTVCLRVHVICVALTFLT
jgi:hypothetical protein